MRAEVSRTTASSNHKQVVAVSLLVLLLTSAIVGSQPTLSIPACQQGRALEQSGKRLEAARMYAATTNDHACYAALVRLVEAESGQGKASLLKMMLPSLRPYQALKAAEELQASGAADPGTLLSVAEAASAVRDPERQRQLLEAASKSPTDSLEKMKAMEKLASLARKEGDLARAVDWLRQARGLKVKSQEADVARRRLDEMIQMLEG